MVVNKTFGKIFCMGSIIMDVSIKCKEFPLVGETVYTRVPKIQAPHILFLLHCSNNIQMYFSSFSRLTVTNYPLAHAKGFFKLLHIDAKF